MDGQSLECYARRSGVEVFVFQFAFCAAVESVSPIGTEFCHVEKVRAATYFFVRCETYSYIAVLYFRVQDEVFHGGHYFGYAGFVVRAEKG